jgi:hypothetical protein
MHTFTHRRRCQPCKATASSSGPVRVRCLVSEIPQLSGLGLGTYARRRRPTSKRGGAPASDPVDDAAVESASVRGQADGRDVVCEGDSRGELQQADVVVVVGPTVIGVTDNPGDGPGLLVGVAARLVLTAQEDRETCRVSSDRKGKNVTVSLVRLKLMFIELLTNQR